MFLSPFGQGNYHSSLLDYVRISNFRRNNENLEKKKEKNKLA